MSAPGDRHTMLINRSQCILRHRSEIVHCCTEMWQKRPGQRQDPGFFYACSHVSTFARLDVNWSVFVPWELYVLSTLHTERKCLTSGEAGLAPVVMLCLFSAVWEWWIKYDSWLNFGAGGVAHSINMIRNPNKINNLKAFFDSDVHVTARLEWETLGAWWICYAEYSGNGGQIYQCWKLIDNAAGLIDFILSDYLKADWLQWCRCLFESNVLLSFI